MIGEFDLLRVGVAPAFVLEAGKWERLKFNPRGFRTGVEPAGRRGFVAGWGDGEEARRGGRFESLRHSDRCVFGDRNKCGGHGRNLIAEFEPDLVVLDPWNQFADDDKAKETKAAMDGIKHILDAAEKPPACLIVAHHRKKREGDAHKGRQMADLISGSYVMQSNPRCVLCYVAFDPSDENDNRVVMLCPKKNNGKHKGPATAWTLCENGFEAMPDFDYKAWQDGGTDAKDSKAKIRLEHLQEIFKAGALTRAEAGKKLEALTGAGRSAVSEALTKRFADMIEIIGGGLLLTLRDEYKPGGSPFDEDD